MIDKLIPFLDKDTKILSTMPHLHPTKKRIFSKIPAKIRQNCTYCVHCMKTGFLSGRYSLPALKSSHNHKMPGYSLSRLSCTCLLCHNRAMPCRTDSVPNCPLKGGRKTAPPFALHRHSLPNTIHTLKQPPRYWHSVIVEDSPVHLILHA